MFTIKINILRQELKKSIVSEMKFKGAVNSALSFYVLNINGDIIQIIPWRNRGVGVMRKLINKIKSVDKADSIVLSNGYWDWRILIHTK